MNRTADYCKTFTRKMFIVEFFFFFSVDIFTYWTYYSGNDDIFFFIIRFLSLFYSAGPTSFKKRGGRQVVRELPAVHKQRTDFDEHVSKTRAKKNLV